MDRDLQAGANNPTETAITRDNMKTAMQPTMLMLSGG